MIDLVEVNRTGELYKLVRTKQSAWLDAHNIWVIEGIDIKLKLKKLEFSNVEVYAHAALEKIVEARKTKENPILDVSNTTSTSSRNTALAFAAHFEAAAFLAEADFCLDWWWCPSGNTKRNIIFRIRDVGLHELAYPPTANEQLFKV